MKILTIIGTRPDAIKLLPVHTALLEEGIDSILCSTAQHAEMLDQVLKLFNIKPSFNLQIMKEGQDLFDITQNVLLKIKPILESLNPDLILVQGDTSTSFVAALGAFYKKIPIGHVEAGLRTDSLYSPYPEEMNRRFIGMVSTYHFAATSLNVANLLAEGIPRDKILLTGNTVIDSLLLIKNKIEKGTININSTLFELIHSLKKDGKTIALLTAHRRESFNGGLDNIFKAAIHVANSTQNLALLYPHHPNPHIIEAINRSKIKYTPMIYFLPPLDYSDLIYTLLESNWVATDSGGIQEEAVSLGKPVVILRNKTERIEGVWAGLAYLAGTETKQIIKYMLKAHQEKDLNVTTNIYGDGQASKKIASFIGSLVAHNDASDELKKLSIRSGFSLKANNQNPRREV